MLMGVITHVAAKTVIPLSGAKIVACTIKIMIVMSDASSINVF